MAGDALIWPRGECWIPVPLPPPVLPRQTFSGRLRACQMPGGRGPSHKNLRTAVLPLKPQNLSLGPFVSKAPDFADLVQKTRKRLILLRLLQVEHSALFERSLGDREQPNSNGPLTDRRFPRSLARHPAVSTFCLPDRYSLVRQTLYEWTDERAFPSPSGRHPLH